MVRLTKPSRRNRRRKKPAVGKPPPSPVVKVHPISSLGWVIPVSIFIITIVVFIPTLQNGFVNWDDESFLVANSNYRGLGWQQFRWMFTTCYLSSCMPLTWVTYSLDYVFWGMNPFGYHLSSLLISCRQRGFVLFCQFATLATLRVIAKCFVAIPNQASRRFCCALLRSPPFAGGGGGMGNRPGNGRCRLFSL